MPTTKPAPIPPSTTSWPPSTLATTTSTGGDNTNNDNNATNICALTNSLEAAGGGMDLSTLQIQMAANLYTGDLASCRHLWRRHDGNDPVRAALLPWYKVATAMQTHNAAALWQTLSELPAATAAAPSSSASTMIPVAQYAQDIAQAYRVRILKPYIIRKQQQQQQVHGQTTTALFPPSFLVPLLGFSSMADLEMFCAQNMALFTRDERLMEPKNSIVNMPTQQAALLAFLESQMAL